jgi:hypothetical protein
MNYIKVTNSVVTYPYSMQQLQQDYPNTSFSPATYSQPDILKDFNVFMVEPVGIPQYNEIYTKVLEGTPVETNGVWYQTWTIEPCSAEEVTQNIETAKTNLQDAVQNRLDSFAQTRNYNSMMSCCTYATSTNPKFQQEAQYCVQARDAHWGVCYVVLEQFESGQRTMPTVAELLSLMPPLEWPV